MQNPLTLLKNLREGEPRVWEAIETVPNEEVYPLLSAWAKQGWVRFGHYPQYCYLTKSGVEAVQAA